MVKRNFTKEERNEMCSKLGSIFTICDKKILHIPMKSGHSMVFWLDSKNVKSELNTCIAYSTVVNLDNVVLEENEGILKVYSLVGQKN